MPIGKLTLETVKTLSAGPKDQFLWDDKLRGFGLKVTPAGNKVFLFQYRLGGRASKTKRYTIGPFGTWTPQQAREEAGRLDQLVGKGIDPLADKQERQRVATDLAFDSVADRFLDTEIAVNWKRSFADVKRLLALHVRPVLKDKPLPSIPKGDITALLDRLPVEQVALRRKVWAVLSRFFTWAVAKDLIERSPLEAAEPPPAPEARKRWLRDWELRLVWLASEGLGYPFGPFYRLLVLTGQRREEVSALDWRELNRASAEWHIPGGRTKNSEPTTVHLSALAIAELDAIAGGDKWKRKGLVFTTTGTTAVSGYSNAKARLDAAMLDLARKEAEEAGEDPDHVEIEPWRVHDLRRTVATDFQRLGVRFEVTEAALNHVSGAKSGVAGIYQQHDWRPEKRDAFNAWAVGLQRVVDGQALEPAEAINVTPLAARRA